MTTTTKTTTVNALLCGENLCFAHAEKKNALSEKTHRRKEKKIK